MEDNDSFFVCSDLFFDDESDSELESIESASTISCDDSTDSEQSN